MQILHSGFSAIAFDMPRMISRRRCRLVSTASLYAGYLLAREQNRVNDSSPVSPSRRLLAASSLGRPASIARRAARPPLLAAATSGARVFSPPRFASMASSCRLCYGYQLAAPGGRDTAFSPAMSFWRCWRTARMPAAWRARRRRYAARVGGSIRHGRINTH